MRMASGPARSRTSSSPGDLVSCSYGTVWRPHLPRVKSVRPGFSRPSRHLPSFVTIRRGLIPVSPELGRDEAETHLPHRVVPVGVHQHDRLPDSQSRAAIQHRHHQAGRDKDRHYMVRPVAGRTVAVAPVEAAGQQSLQGVHEIRNAPRPGLDQRYPTGRVGSEHRHQTVSPRSAERHHMRRQVRNGGLPACANHESLGVQVRIRRFRPGRSGSPIPR